MGIKAGDGGMAMVEGKDGRLIHRHSFGEHLYVVYTYN